MARASPILLSLPVKANILIDQTGHARLADFGLLTIISDPANLLPSTSYTQGGTARWMSPELVAPHRFGFKDSHPTKASDCYALGMVAYETISGNLPFHQHRDLAVAMKVLEGEHPPRNTRFTEGLWKVLEQCWAYQPDDRLGVEDVLQYLVTHSNSTEPFSPGVDAEMETVGDNWDSESNSSGVPNEVDDRAMTGRYTATSSGVNQLTNNPLSEANLSPPIPQINPNGGDTYQSLYSVLYKPGVERPDLNIQTLDRDQSPRTHSPVRYPEGGLLPTILTPTTGEVCTECRSVTHTICHSRR